MFHYLSHPFQSDNGSETTVSRFLLLAVLFILNRPGGVTPSSKTRMIGCKSSWMRQCSYPFT